MSRPRAACAGAPGALFFPDLRPTDSPGWAALQPFVQELTADYCIGCQVRLECITTALTYPNTDGIWGGTTPPSRAGETRTPAEVLAALEAVEIPPLPAEEAPAA